MVLQQFAFLQEGRAEIEDLYIRFFGDVVQKGQKVWLKQGAFLQTDTYFNGFFSEEWKTYSCLSKIGCTVEVQGMCVVEFFITRKKGKQKKEQVLKRQNYCSKERGKVVFCFALSELEGIAAIRVIAVKDAFFYGGSWEYGGSLEKDTVCFKPVQIALVICTYRKEKELMKNLDYLQKMIFENAKSPLLDRIHIYIVDNGRTMPLSLQNCKIQVIPNRNTGGAGGFARGMKEAVKEKERYGFSHILLMDDDVRIEVSSLEKTAALLSCIKEEYCRNFIGGAMFRQDYPWIQHEAGGIWKDGRLKAIGQQLDLRKIEVLLQKKRAEERPNYAAWWYCCIPLRYVEEKGYPMPFFIHFDDVEYSLRGKQVPIYMHGIGIWHEQFEQKKGSALVYYDTRNSLFLCKRYGDCRKKGRMLKLVLYEFYQAVARYRYRDIELIERAVKDYKKGVEWLQRVDAEKLHTRICRMGYHWKQQEGREHFKEGEWEEEKGKENKLYQTDRKKRKRIWRLLTLNGNLLPAKKEIQPLPLGADLDRFYRLKRVYLYDPVTKRGEWVKKDWKELIQGFQKLAEMVILLCFCE